MNVLISILVGFLVGAHIAMWGMYKDAPHEGFTLRRFSRSILLATGIAPIVALVFGLDSTSASGMVLLFGLTYAMERAVNEFYKTFVREEDQSKYFIPMQFHVLGRVVQSRWLRLAAGAGMVGFALVLLGLVRFLESAPGPELPRTLLAASLGGWFAAFGGAWKDAPIEGFELFKFFRSPAVAGFFGWLVSPLTQSLVVVSLCGVGFSVATLETYKTFFFPSRPRGKFAGKPVLYPSMLRRRRYAVPLYVLIWAVLGAAFVASYPDAAAADASGGHATTSAGRSASR